MKASFHICLFFLAIAYSTHGEANVQEISGRSPTIKESNLYIETSRLYFSDEGIFLRTDSNQLMPLNQISYDSMGYFSPSSWFRTSHYEAVCNYCGCSYQDESPQPCTSCDKSEGFTLVYFESEDYWDRY